MDMSDFKKAASGSTIVLRDFHTLEAMGKEYVGVVKDIKKMVSGKVSISCLLVEPAEGVELWVVAIEGVEGWKNPTFRMYRKYSSGDAELIDDPRFIKGSGRPPCVFAPFKQKFDDIPEGEGPIGYNVVPGFPIGIGNGQVCCWEANNEQADENYWAKHCLVEVMQSGMAEVWFGWGVAGTDVDIVAS